MNSVIVYEDITVPNNSSVFQTTFANTVTDDPGWITGNEIVVPAGRLVQVTAQLNTKNNDLPAGARIGLALYDWNGSFVQSRFQYDGIPGSTSPNVNLTGPVSFGVSAGKVRIGVWLTAAGAARDFELAVHVLDVT